MIKNLFESVKNLTEESLPEKLQEATGITKELANDIVKDLSFNKYRELNEAIDSEDSEKVNSFLSEAPIPTTATVTNANANNLEYEDDKGNKTTVNLRQPDAETGLNQLDQRGQTAKGPDGKPLVVTPDTEFKKGDEFSLELKEMTRLKELAGLQETSQSPSFVSSIEAATQSAQDDYNMGQQRERRYHESLEEAPADDAYELYAELAQIFTAGGLASSPDDIAELFIGDDPEGSTRAVADRAMMNLSNYEEYEHHIDDILGQIEYLQEPVQETTAGNVCGGAGGGNPYIDGDEGVVAASEEYVNGGK